jgi:metal-responsive CopG/Arc/MetJ family transcriptional regulator
MKITVRVDRRLWARLKKVAAKHGQTMSQLVETAIRKLLQEDRAALPPLPTFHCGGALVDIANRDELYRAMEGR